MDKKIKPPEPGRLLYKNIFENKDRSDTLEILSKGLFAVAENVRLLIDDIRLLLENKRYERADFLIATANEEIAKSYIILDLCRLDFDLQQGLLRRLCKAFYSHVEKDACNGVFSREIKDMHHAKEVFHIRLVRWWPSGSIESGEPDMPHNIYFTRESNLYVDFIDYDKEWHSPKKSNAAVEFIWSKTPNYCFEELSLAYSRLFDTLNAGLYRPEALDILNSVFRSHYIKEETTNKKLFGLYDEVAGKIEAKLGITKDIFDKSILHGWPCYHFLVL